MKPTHDKAFEARLADALRFARQHGDPAAWHMNPATVHRAMELPAWQSRLPRFFSNDNREPFAMLFGVPVVVDRELGDGVVLLRFATTDDGEYAISAGED